MIELKGMLIIGGNARNVGKTTLACHIIKRFSHQTLINGLKVITHRKGDENSHGSEEKELEENFRITEENDRDIPKDTARMLRAGASRAYMVRAKEEYLDEAIHEFFRNVDLDCIFVCESNSLNNLIKPGVFIMIRSAEVKNEKQNTEEMSRLADKIIYTQGNPWEINQIKLNLNLDQQEWKIK